MATPLAQPAALALQLALLQSHSAQAGLGDPSGVCNLAQQQHQQQQQAALEAYIKLERLRQMQQQQQANPQQDQQPLVSRPAPQGPQQSGSPGLSTVQVATGKDASQAAPKAAAGAVAPGVSGVSANILLQQLWEQQQRAVLLAMLQQQQQQNLQQLLSTMALSSQATRHGSTPIGVPASAPHACTSAVGSGSSSPISGLHSPFSSSISPSSAAHSPLAGSPFSSAPPSPRGPGSAVASASLLPTSASTPKASPAQEPLRLQADAPASLGASAPFWPCAVSAPRRVSPKAVHEGEAEFWWDSSPSTSPRNTAIAELRCGIAAAEKPGPRFQNANVGDLASLDLPSEEEFECHLSCVQLSFM